MKKLLLLPLVFFLAGCNLPVTPTGFPPATITPSPSPTQTLPYEGCAWNWATQRLPDVTEQVQEAIKKAGLEGVTGLAEAYGENCIDPRTNQPASFATLETDFRFTAQVADLKDEELLGNVIEKIIGVLEQLPSDSIPGPQKGYIGIAFQSRGEELHVWFLRETGEAALQKGLHGAALLEEVQKK